MAASATFALKTGVWFRRGRLDMVSPDSQATACPPSGRNSTHRLVQISGTGSDNTRGIIGVAPNVASVRTVSWWKSSDPNTLHVADALLAAVGASPRPHVVLIEVQIGSALLPVETDPANLDAIRLAVASGVVVVEAGGNGNNDLDAWTDSLGKQRLNRSSADFVDS